MTSKRALVVDDSKSARFALKRMLNALKLDVDMVESAVDAMDYLEHHQPDIIFMDHMMPGMDGFEAVKRIKDNPQTAIIPIMMYTSKGGDVYMSQARALGAVGIIRKTIAPVELKDSLLELGLIEDVPVESSLKVETPAASHSSKKPEEVASNHAVTSKNHVLDIYIKDLRKLMDDQTIELHRSMWLGIESVSNEIFNRLNSDLEEKIEKIQAAPKDKDKQGYLSNNLKTFWPTYVMGILLVISISFNIALVSNLNRLDNKIADINTGDTYDDTSETVFRDDNPFIDNYESTTQQRADSQLAIQEFTKWALNKVIEYPYDEVALNDNRLPSIEELIRKAVEVNFKGRIILKTHVGNFCLNSDHMGNYVLADNDQSITECELIGNYIQPSDEPTSHQSLSFVNYLSDTELLNEQGISIEVTSATRKLELAKYPKRIPQTTAEKWNQAAQLNNRITVMLEPEATDLL